MTFTPPTPSKPDETELAVSALITTGMSRGQAYEMLAKHPGERQALAERGAELWATSVTEEAQRLYEQSDEFKRLQADNLIAARKQRAADVERGRELMRASGVPETDLASLDDATILRNAGLPDELPAQDRGRAMPQSSMVRDSDLGTPSAEELAEYHQAMTEIEGRR